MKVFNSISLFLMICFSLNAEIKLNNLFTDNMVLQREKPIRIFGFGSDGDVVTVKLETAEVTVTTVEGQWIAELPAMPAGGPYTVEISQDQERKILKNVLVGDVWICGGQSNMGCSLYFFLTEKNEVYTKSEYKQTPGDYENSQLRFFRIGPKASDHPENNIIAGKNYGPDFGQLWRECMPKEATNFSALGYFFGKTLQPELKIPIGLIANAVGGVPIESYMSIETLKTVPESRGYVDFFEQLLKNYSKKYALYEKSLHDWEAKKEQGLQAQDLGNRPTQPQGRSSVYRPAVLFNSMVYPLRNFPIKGVLWYQGESNVIRSKEYQKVFPAFIQDWRKNWGQSDLPFLFVQLAAVKDYQEKIPSDQNVEAFAFLREAQQKVLQTTPNTGMVSSIDWGSTDDIHPPYKRVLGERLAALALNQVYGDPKSAVSPEMESIDIIANKAVVTFKNVGEGLQAIDRNVNEFGPKQYSLSKEQVSGFAVCGEDRQFYWAQGKVISKNKVEVEATEVKTPLYIRYAFSPFPLVNLYNSAGLPALPFRTDDFLGPPSSYPSDF